MNKQNSRRLAMVLVMAMAVVSGAAAFADTAAGLPSVKVRYGDLDLAREDGVQALYSRLRAAARRVCDIGVSGDVFMHIQSRRCAETTLSNAVAKLNNPRLLALHTGAGRRPAEARIAATGS